MSRTRVRKPAASSRRTRRAGRLDAWILTSVPTGISWVSRPSAETNPGSSPTTSRLTTLLAPSTNDRSKTICAAIGVTMRHGTSGETIGPRAENEYAVEPVGVATITPSAENVVTYSPSTATWRRISRCLARFSTMISFIAHCGGKGSPLPGSATTASRSSIAARPSSASRISGAASGGSTSVRKPRRPTLTPRTGESACAAT